MSNTAYALTGFVSWALFLLVLMEGIRTNLVVTKKVRRNQPTDRSLTSVHGPGAVIDRRQ